jgi:hypothetical protein
MTEEQVKLIQTLDRIIETSNRIDEKLKQILDLIQEKKTHTFEYDGEIMFRNKKKKEE